jgi:hypothetical protein
LSPPKSRWESLHDDIERARQANAHTVTQISTDMVRRLHALGTHGRCSPQARGWLQARRAERTTKLDIKHSADGRDAWGRPAVLLHGLDHLEDGAVLTVSIDMDSRRSIILSYSVSIEGIRCARPDEAAEPRRRWHARIDLTEAPAGKVCADTPSCTATSAPTRGRTRSSRRACRFPGCTRPTRWTG